MTEIDGIIQFTQKIDTQSAPKERLKKALKPSSEMICSEVSELFDRMGVNAQNSFPMESVGGVTPEPISLIQIRLLDQENKPAKTLEVKMKDKDTVLVLSTDATIGTFTRNYPLDSDPCWVGNDDNVDPAPFNELMHKELTILVNQSGYKEHPNTCNEAIRDHLIRHPMDEVFAANHKKTNNLATLKP